jgi:sec-independent protein translocase protein TatA
MEALTPGHLLLLLIGFVVLFGYKKLPEASRSVGRSLRIFKSEMRSMSGEEPPAGIDAAAPAWTGTVPSAAGEWEAEAAAAEARAAELRARAQASRPPSAP